ncbi:hypothetical protein RHSIM_Rhsim10G0193300 [Rhododendron simsii]|uniref:Ionotropic glutamate receptor C-terminal domain-containing protein n=1 Tax=Rhododendron simsii TaxID=118357 RepID=A0A834GF54_RHOSS|nr:hypothetical protein RHSIM_Rhsim10G0193300 [Rhododendron simsii]
MFKGYCIDVFMAALNLLPYALPYKLIPFGDGVNNPSCTELVRLITAGVYDAAIADIAIITNRSRMVDCTQPYIEFGLVVVAPVKKLNSDAWAFLRPFSGSMWIVTGVFFLLVGTVVWILDHRLNDDFRGPPRKQVVTILCELGIQESRLIALNSPEEYAEALKKGPNNGGVAALVDESIDRTLPLFALRIQYSCSQGAKLAVDRLQLKSFSGLFIICGLACLLALLVYFVKMVGQYIRHYSGEEPESSGSSRSSHFQTFLTFGDEKEEDVKNRSKRRQLERDSNRNNDSGMESTSAASNRRCTEMASNRSVSFGSGV